jgi:hypothetical protein
MKWLKEMPDPRDKADLVRSVCFSIKLEDRDPAYTAQLAMLLPQGDGRQSVLDDVARQWTKQDPSGAIEWATQQEDDRVRGNAFARIAADWLAKDPIAAREWVDALPASSEKTRMLENAVNLILEGTKFGTPNFAPTPVIRSMSSEGIRETARWIEGINDAHKRESAYERLAVKWLERDPESARASITVLPLSQDVKDRLLSGRTPK